MPFGKGGYTKSTVKKVSKVKVVKNPMKGK